MNNTKYLILIDSVTGTVLNYDDQVFIVDTESLSDEDKATMEEWYETGSDRTIIGLAHKVGVPVTKYEGN